LWRFHVFDRSKKRWKTPFAIIAADPDRFLMVISRR
jgi:hypothetical protein